MGVDNLGVVRHVGRLLDDCSFATPLELVTDGDVLVLIRRMLDLRGCDTVRVTKVRGHADEGMVFDGRVRDFVRIGNNAADEAADFGPRRVGSAVIEARRNLSGGRGRWYPVILDLHRFFIVISRAVADHEGNNGTAPGPAVTIGVDDVAQWPYTPGLWLSGLPFLDLCIGPLGVWTLVLVVFLMLN